MRIPKMVLFDYGQTLIAEKKFDGVKGTEAVLHYATKNKYHLSAGYRRKQMKSIGNLVDLILRKDIYFR